MEIIVGDINDNTPVFKPQNYSVSVTENSPVGTHLLDVHATDADSGQNAYITYTITHGDPRKVFQVETKVISLLINIYRLHGTNMKESFYF